MSRMFVRIFVPVPFVQTFKKLLPIDLIRFQIPFSANYITLMVFWPSFAQAS